MENDATEMVEDRLEDIDSLIKGLREKIKSEQFRSAESTISKIEENLTDLKYILEEF